MRKFIILLCLLFTTPLWAADNIQINEGTSGKMVATEETGGANYQKIKLIDGTPASTTPITQTGGALDINIKSGNPTTITATQGTATNLKTEAECYQGGAVVAPGNPLQVTLANGSVPSTAVTNIGNFTVQATDSVVSANGLNIKVAYIAGQTGATVLTPTAGKKVAITDIVVSAASAGVVYLFDNTDTSTTAITPTLSLSANGGYISNLRKPFVSSAANNVIKYTSGASATGSILLLYYEI